MKTLAWMAATITWLVLLCGCERRYAKQDIVLEDLGPPSVDVTAVWTGSWQDPKRGTSEVFTMDLRQEGTNVTGAASFMDENGTRAEVGGRVSGSKLRLLMAPLPTAPYDPIPETTWLGTVSNGTISGTWYFHGKPYRGYASTGPWSASTNSRTVWSPASGYTGPPVGTISDSMSFCFGRKAGRCMHKWNVSFSLSAR